MRASYNFACDELLVGGSTPTSFMRTPFFSFSCSISRRMCLNSCIADSTPTEYSSPINRWTIVDVAKVNFNREVIHNLGGCFGPSLRSYRFTMTVPCFPLLETNSPWTRMVGEEATEQEEEEEEEKAAAEAEGA